MSYYEVTGRFEGRGDTDWYRVYLEGGQTYLLDSNGNDGSLRTAAGDVIILNYQKGYIAQTGWYFVEARALYGDVTAYGYTLAPLVDDGVLGNPLTTGTIALDQTVTIENAGYAAHAADDWFGFDALAGRSYQFDGVVTGSPQALDLQVYDANGVAVSDSGHFSATTGGRYFVAVDRDFVSSYTLTMHAVADDYAQTTATKGSITVGVDTVASFEGAGDVDWFKVQLTAGHSYLMSASDGLMGVADTSGELVRAFAEPASVFSAAISGTYYVMVKDFRGDGPTDYRVSFLDFAGELADNATTKGSVTAGGPSVQGGVDASDDVDWWAIQAKAGVSYQIAGTDRVTYRVYDGASHQITSDYARTFTAAADGVFYIAVAGTAETVHTVYQFSVTSYVDDYAATAATSGRAVVGQAVTGRLEVTDDTDWFAVELKAGVTYQAGSYEVLGRFRDGSGAVLSGPNDGNIFTPSTSGTYYLEIAGGWENYTATISEIRGDVPGNAITTAEMPLVWIGTPADDRHAGGEHADALNGADGGDRLYGLGGDDRLIGGDGNDLLTGGAGNDTLDGSEGANRLIGEDGNDTMYAYGDTATMTGGGGDDTYWIGAGVRATVIEKAGGGVDTIATYAPSLTLRSEVENLEGWAEGTGQTLTGNTLANRISGYTGKDVIDGGAASDTLFGASGSDRLIGGDGADTLYGGSGDDLIRGGTGSDLLSGGTGADRFLFIPGDLGVSGDRITDFNGAEGDRIDLAGYGALAFIGAAAFSGKAGQLRSTSGATTVVQADLDGDRAADITIKLDGAMTLGKANFVLAAGAMPIEHHAPQLDAGAHLLDPLHVMLA